MTNSELERDGHRAFLRVRLDGTSYQMMAQISGITMTVSGRNTMEDGLRKSVYNSLWSIMLLQQWLWRDNGMTHNSYSVAIDSHAREACHMKVVIGHKATATTAGEPCCT
jgi:hypothetical protein